jgi:hypothetical protein
MQVLWGALCRTVMASRGGGGGETAVASGAPLAHQLLEEVVI